MPSKLDPHIATIEGWLAAQPQLTALAIVGRLSEKHPEEFGTRQHSIVQRLLRALRRKTAEQLVAEESLGDATTAAPLPGVVDGSGYVGPDPPTAPPTEQAWKATWRGQSVDIASTAATAPSAGQARHRHLSLAFVVGELFKALDNMRAKLCGFLGCSSSLRDCPELGLQYASGVGRRVIVLVGRPALEPSRIFFVHPDELDQIFDSEVGEGHDAVFAGAIDPDDADLGIWSLRPLKPGGLFRK
ncbi:hypothetical protein CQ10_38055 [Bradyrhizobium valentinum]|nr:hypothetical protein CQ10_38055 [Bradyrhizobium valentinum]